MTLIGVQQRLTELGRIRTGEKGTKGEPKRLTKFRLTSASRPMLEAAAKRYGGTVRAWQGAPDDGYWELYTESDAIDILIPPTTRGYSQTYELWDAGGAVRRCDGEIEAISGQECLCDPDKRLCQITTRVQVMLPHLPGLGVWRVESHGWNAAAKLPSTLELLRSVSPGAFIPAVLRLVAKSKRIRLPNGKAQTHRWMEPEIDTPRSMGELLALAAGGDQRALVGGTEVPAIEPGPSRPPRGTKVDRPQLGPAPELPATSDFRKPEDPTPAVPPPPSISGWMVADDEPSEPVGRPQTPAPEAAAAERGPKPRRSAAAPDTPPPEPLTFEEFSRRVRGSGATENDVIEATRLRFPSAKRLSELADDERGRLLADIERMVRTPVSA